MNMVTKRVLSVCLFAATVASAEEFFVYEGNPLVEPAKVVTKGDGIVPVGDRFRLCTYNLENFTDGIGDEPSRNPEVASRHADMAAERLSQINADIVVMQEIENAAMISQLASKIKPPMPYVCISDLGAGGPDVQKLNLAVLSRVELQDVVEVDFGLLKGAGRPTRGLLRFTVPLEEGRALLVYVVHLKSNYGNRNRNVAQRKGALEILRKDADAFMATHADTAWEVAVLGDMNVDPDASEFTTDESLSPLKDWVDLWRKEPKEKRFTLPTRYGDAAREFPPVAFDRVIVSPAATESPWKVTLLESLPGGVATHDSNILPGFEGHVSDHLPVYVDFVK